MAQPSTSEKANLAAILQQQMQLALAQNEQMKQLTLAQNEQAKAQNEQMRIISESLIALTQQLQPRSTAGSDSFGDTTEGATRAGNEESVVTALINRLPTFEFSLEEERTFEKYWERHGESVQIDRLSESSQRRVVLAKLSDSCFEQLVAAIAPKKPSELQFSELIRELTSLFEVKRSIFAARLACLSTSRQGDDPGSYTNRVNQVCERAKLGELALDDWKAFVFLRGLDSSADAELRKHLMQFAELRSAAQMKVGLKELYAEWLRVESVMRDAREVEKGAVKAFQVSREGKMDKDKDKDVDKEKSKRKGRFGNRRNSRRPIEDVECYKCGEKGHYQSSCGKSRDDSSRTTRCTSASVTKCVAQSSVAKSARQYLDVYVNGRRIEFQLDTGSDITIIGRREWELIGKPELKPVGITVRCANGSELGMIGRTNVSFRLARTDATGVVYVREEGNLLGLDWTMKSPEMSQLLEQIVSTIRVEGDDDKVSGETKSDLEVRFPKKIKKGLKRCEKKVAELRVVEGAKPISKEAHPVPCGKLEVVEWEVDRKLRRYDCKIRRKSTEQLGNASASSRVTPSAPSVDADIVIAGLSLDDNRSELEGSVRQLPLLVAEIVEASMEDPTICGVVEDVCDEKSPVELHFERSLRARSSLMRPAKCVMGSTRRREESKEDHYDQRNGVRNRRFRVGDEVQVRCHKDSKWSWQSGVVTKAIGKVMFVVDIDGKLRRCHKNQVVVRNFGEGGENEEALTKLGNAFLLPEMSEIAGSSRFGCIVESLPAEVTTSPTSMLSSTPTMPVTVPIVHSSKSKTLDPPTTPDVKDLPSSTSPTLIEPGKSSGNGYLPPPILRRSTRVTRKPDFYKSSSSTPRIRWK